MIVEWFARFIDWLDRRFMTGRRRRPRNTCSDLAGAVSAVVGLSVVGSARVESMQSDSAFSDLLLSAPRDLLLSAPRSYIEPPRPIMSEEALRLLELLESDVTWKLEEKRFKDIRFLQFHHVERGIFLTMRNSRLRVTVSGVRLTLTVYEASKLTQGIREYKKRLDQAKVAAALTRPTEEGPVRRFRSAQDAPETETEPDAES